MPGAGCCAPGTASRMRRTERHTNSTARLSGTASAADAASRNKGLRSIASDDGVEGSACMGSRRIWKRVKPKSRCRMVLGGKSCSKNGGGDEGVERIDSVGPRCSQSREMEAVGPAKDQWQVPLALRTCPVWLPARPVCRSEAVRGHTGLDTTGLDTTEPGR